MSTALRLLVVEDNPADIDLIRELLPPSGPWSYIIESVPRLAAALTRLADNSIDLVLLDLSLPDSQGLATYRQLRDVVPKVPVIVLTGNTDENLAVLAVRDGAQDYLIKGQLTSNLLGRAVRYAIERMRTALVLQESLREKEFLLKEIHHRVKNNLQLVSSLLNMQGEQIDSPAVKTALIDLRSRVRSMGMIHEHLYRSENLAKVDLITYLTQLCEQLHRVLVVTPESIQLHLELAAVNLAIDQAVPCGLLVNELVTNAFKHAFPAGRCGEVWVELQALSAGAGLRLRVADNGVGMPPELDPQHFSSLGLKLGGNLARQLGGHLEIGPGPGTEVVVTFQRNGD